MATDILDELLKLPPAERVEIAMALWESLSPAEQEAEFRLTPEQEAELDRRWAEHQSDPGSAIPWEVVERELKNRTQA
jgi:putative addiction module component (TIGR02574 family)